MTAAPVALSQLAQPPEINGSPAPASPPVPAATQAPVSATPPPPAPPRTPSVNLILNPLSGPIAVGATFQVPVVLTGGADIASVPLKIKFDPAKLTLVNVDQGDFLGRDGKPPALLHIDDGAGLITINNSRPPGAPGMSGAGVVCVLSFQGKATGDSAIAIAGSGVTTSAMQSVSAAQTQITVQVR